MRKSQMPPPPAPASRSICCKDRNDVAQSCVQESAVEGLSLETVLDHFDQFFSAKGSQAQ